MHTEVALLREFCEVILAALNASNWPTTSHTTWAERRGALMDSWICGERGQSQHEHHPCAQLAVHTSPETYGTVGSLTPGARHGL